MENATVAASSLPIEELTKLSEFCLSCNTRRWENFLAELQSWWGWQYRRMSSQLNLRLVSILVFLYKMEMNILVLYYLLEPDDL